MKKCGLITEKGNLVPLKDVEVEIQISGFVAHVIANLQYENNEDMPIEAEFTFPLDDGSAVYKFEALIDGRHIIAECQEKEEAKKTYDDAIAAGDTAMLLEEDSTAGDIFRCLVGNLPPKSAAKLTMGYVIELPVEHDGKLRFTLPVILNPRYSPNVGGLESAKGATYVLKQKDIPYSFKLSASVEGTKDVKSVTASQPHIDVQIRDDKKQAKVVFKEDFTFDADVRLFVEYENPNDVECLVEKGDSEKSGFLAEDILMLNLCPKVDTVGTTNKGEYIFVLDRSGSMGFGQNRIKHAKEALLLFVKSLPVGCYFNIVSFGSSHKFLFAGGSKEYSEESLKTATDELKQMEADMGGTEILQPLEAIYRKRNIDGHPRQIFLLTDGEVGNVGEVIKITKKNASNTRVFTIGIGEGASTSLVNGVARAGNGKAEFIKDSERMQPKIVSLLKFAMQPSITNVTIGWELPSNVTAVTIPDIPPCLFDGDRLILYAMIQGLTESQLSGKVFINGKTDKGPANFSANFFLDKTAEVSRHAPFHRLAAKAQIKLLEDKDESDEIKKQIIAVSVASNMVSSHTSFVAIDKEIKEKVEGKNESDEIKKQIIAVSVASNMVSSHTSFVAIDKERKEKIEGKSIKRNVPITADMYMADLCLQSSLCSSAMYDSSFGGGPKKKGAMGFPNPFKGLFSRKEKSRATAAPAPARAMPMGGAMMMKSSAPQKKSKMSRKAAPVLADEVMDAQIDLTLDDESDEDVEMKLEEKQVSLEPMMDMIILQCFGGNWKLDAKLCKMLKVETKMLKDLNLSQSINADNNMEMNLAEKRSRFVPMMDMIVLQCFGGNWKLDAKLCKMLKVESKVLIDLNISQSINADNNKEMNSAEKRISFEPMMDMIVLQCFGGNWKLDAKLCKMLKVESKVLKDLNLSQIHDNMEMKLDEKQISFEPMMDMIVLQCFGGNWKLDAKLCKMLKVESKILEDLILSQDDDVVATLSVLVWLELNFNNHYNEWEMIKNKAVTWLTNKSLDDAVVKEKTKIIRDSLGTKLKI